MESLLAGRLVGALGKPAVADLAANEQFFEPAASRRFSVGLGLGRSWR